MRSPRSWTHGTLTRRRSPPTSDHTEHHARGVLCVSGGFCESHEEIKYFAFLIRYTVPQDYAPYNGKKAV